MINVFRHFNKLLYVPSEGGRATGGAGCSIRLVVPCEDSHHKVFSFTSDFVAWFTSLFKGKGNIG